MVQIELLTKGNKFYGFHVKYFYNTDKLDMFSIEKQLKNILVNVPIVKDKHGDRNYSFAIPDIDNIKVKKYILIPVLYELLNGEVDEYVINRKWDIYRDGEFDCLIPVDEISKLSKQIYELLVQMTKSEEDFNGEEIYFNNSFIMYTFYGEIGLKDFDLIFVVDNYNKTDEYIEFDLIEFYTKKMKTPYLVI